MKQFIILMIVIGLSLSAVAKQNVIKANKESLTLVKFICNLGDDGEGTIPLIAKLRAGDVGVNVEACYNTAIDVLLSEKFSKEQLLLHACSSFRDRTYESWCLKAGISK